MYYEEVKEPEAPTLTQAEVIFLEGQEIHAPVHAFRLIERAIAAKRHDEYARLNGHTTEPKQFSPELEMLAGICQKVTFNEHTKEQFRVLYQSAFAQGCFRRSRETGTYVTAIPARINPYR